MGSQVVQCFTIFLSFLFFSSGSSVAETPPLAEIQKNRITDDQENQIPFSSPVFTAQFDTTGTVPIVNPTTPGTTNPIVNPIESPPAPTAFATTPPAPTAFATTPPAPTAVTTTPPVTTTPTSSGGSWCIASPTAAETALQVAIDYACGYGGADCSAIQPGASCYNPSTLRDHASYAFNDYYQKNPTPNSCVFGGTAQLTNTDPSTGNCHYASPNSTPSLSPPVNPTPTMPTTPTTPTTTTTTPTTMTPPITTTPYGVAEPTGLPSSAISVSFSLMLLCSTVATVGSFLAANHL